MAETLQCAHPNVSAVSCTLGYYRFLVWTYCIKEVDTLCDQCGRRWTKKTVGDFQYGQRVMG